MEKADFTQSRHLTPTGMGGVPELGVLQSALDWYFIGSGCFSLSDSLFFSLIGPPEYSFLGWLSQAFLTFTIIERYSGKSSIQKCKCSHLKGSVLLSCSSSVTHNPFSKVLRRIAEGISKHSRYWHLRQTNLTANIRLCYHSLALWFGAS